VADVHEDWSKSLQPAESGALSVLSSAEIAREGPGIYVVNGGTKGFNNHG